MDKLGEYLTAHEHFYEKLEYLKAQEPKSFAWIASYTIVLGYIAYCTGQAIYRLTWHPLARFPGPFLCKIGYLQQGYYEAILNGMFIHEIAKYHRRYGKSFPFSFCA